MASSCDGSRLSRYSSTARFLNSVLLSDKNTSRVPKRRTTLSLNSFKIVLEFALRMGIHSTYRVNKSWNTKMYSCPDLLFVNGPVISPAMTCQGRSMTRWPISPAGGLCSAFVC